MRHAPRSRGGRVEKIHGLDNGDLFAVLGNVSHEGCFSREYWRWEQQIATPRLQSLGFTVVRWWTEDGDSFGPLVRAVTVEWYGDEYVLTYG